jgi:hypothetical protein
MSKEKLNNLIDKVIGKDGPLRVPAYWMNKTLKNIGELISSIADHVNNVEKNLGSTKTELEASLAQKADKTAVDAKADKISIESYSYSVSPNVYTTYTINSTTNSTIKLSRVRDTSIYNEYIMEIKCTATPSVVDFKDSNNNTISIKWSNDNVPIFEAGYTYIISIVNNFGVFAKFANS